MFTDQDINLFWEKGIGIETIEKQIENFRNGFPFANLIAPATKENGIKVVNEEEKENLLSYFDEIKEQKEIVKFVPASGAASRMFKHLFAFLDWYAGSEDDYKKLQKDNDFSSVYNFVSNLNKFAFFEGLQEILSKNNYDLDHLINGKQFHTIIDFLLNDKGLGYGKLPKALLLFHNYNDRPRFAIEEHLVEGAYYAQDGEGLVRLHFTVSPEHIELFEDVIDEVVDDYQSFFNVVYDISYSVQKPSTDTIAVDMENKPFRNDDGAILFRPGGHGALIENLNDVPGDLIFIKNIDNIVPDHLREETYVYKKIIGACLVKLQDKTFKYLKELENIDISDEKLQEIADFACNELNIMCDFQGYEKMEKVNFLYTKLNRPIRVCGMVKNEGEPGGGPFWVKNSEGFVSLQIVETSQINLDDTEQKEHAQNATHFNPVDLVCGVKNYKGNQFFLKDFVDHSTGFISVKSKDGKELKAQELPGLWNGAMANWTTIFVEVPIITFNPVKTVNDLLREQHQ